MIITPTTLLQCPAPAKLNLFLHVTGRRADGYHLLQTAFQLIDHGDLLDFHLRQDGMIERSSILPGVPAETDLVVRAAKLLQSHTGCQLGASISLEKKLAMGVGLGGGSSDAATTLIALNRLWKTRLSRSELMALGLQLGADIPFFIFGQNAFGEGVGEELTPITTPDCWYVVVEPGVHVPTPAIFSAKELTRDTKPITVSDFQQYLELQNQLQSDNWKNDLQSVAEKMFLEISDVLSLLKKYGDARMTGSGSCVFCQCKDEAQADDILRNIPQKWNSWKSRSLQQHPLSGWLD